jgi:AraC-like DNA-binding protein
MPTLNQDEFLIGAAGISAYPPGATFGPRVLYDFEFIWIMEGTAVAVLDGQKIPAPAGTVLLGRPGMVDRYDWDRERRTVLAYLHFSFDYSAPDWPPLKEWPLSRRLGNDDILRSLFRYVVGLAQSNPAGRNELLGDAVTLMLRAFLTGRSTLAPEPLGELPAAVEKALGAIRRALAHDPPEPLTLPALAQAAHVAPEHLCRLFRRHLDLAPLECVGLARLERAASLLVRSNLSVKEIADATGFVSPYHFSNKFRGVYGVPPREYRKAMRAGFMILGNPLIQRLQLQIPESGG